MNELISEAGRHHLRWALTDGVGPIRFQKLLARFGSAEEALGASAAQLEAIEGIGRQSADTIARAAASVQIDAELDAAAENDLYVLCSTDELYPPGLLKIPDPPIVLFVRGDLRPTDAIAVAVVGSRRCSIYGSEQARRFGELLSGAGLTVVSGLARGVDAFAHHGAVDSGGRSIAVMGTGLADIYPPENRPLADKLLEHGAWLSELPTRTVVRAANFPSRNRIIAGMTLGTLVVEAAARSGALITARLASEYNREVFAIPGRVQDAMSIGTNALIRDGGAKLATCLEDILTELGAVGKAFEPAAKKADGQGILPLPLDPIEERILAALSREPMTQEQLLSDGSTPAGQLLATLTSLELKGRVKRLPGNLYQRIAAS
ncbi:MAG: DNA-protecting protein DprA [Planctomycetes bacterium]|nr:DNA-protecting protein DprA [Planctomycetota bacterium]